MPLVIIGCSKRKRFAPNHDLTGASLARVGSLQEIGSSWVARLKTSRASVSASQLYCGRNFSDGLLAARVINAPVRVVSAGLGLIDSDCNVPPYSLSIAGKGPDNILSHLQGEASASDWWLFLSNNSPIGRRAGFREGARAGELVLVALSAAYLAMVEHDLLSDAHPSQLRIFCGGPLDKLPSKLRGFVMPYDNRLDGPDSPLPGTGSDFAARAMRHFAETVFANQPNGTSDNHRNAVQKALSDWSRPTVPDRSRRTDEELLDLIDENWEATEGHSTRMLRRLRDDLGIACEQTRLKNLFARVRSERGAK